ncbi:helix-turn-helix domain-containing protein [Flavobacterium sp.]|uniref:helix-turn-helix domain-containing protein n=1 Tax=Flavobacterium sp. TaxID=239 RepID=UPI004047283E
MINKLKEIRLKNNYTQEYIASELGITQKAYSKLENGQTCLSQDKIIKLVKIYNISPDYFCNIACECSNNSNITVKIKDFLKEKGIDLPNFLK